MADHGYADPEKKGDSDDNLQPTTTLGEGTTRRGSVLSGRRRASVFSTGGRRQSITDDVFGEITEDGPNYRAVRYDDEQHPTKLRH